MKNPFAKWKQQYGSTKEDSFISKQKKTILPSKTSSFSSVKNQDEKERNETTSEEYIVTVPYKASRYPKNNNKACGGCLLIRTFDCNSKEQIKPWGLHDAV